MLARSCGFLQRRLVDDEARHRGQLGQVFLIHFTFITNMVDAVFDNQKCSSLSLNTIAIPGRIGI